jgi:hypothetical protein
LVSTGLGELDRLLGKDGYPDKSTITRLGLIHPNIDALLAPLHGSPVKVLGAENRFSSSRFSEYQNNLPSRKTAINLDIEPWNAGSDSRIEKLRVSLLGPVGHTA